MKGYTVKQLARLSGVSVRALHHYDAIGLLKPAFVGENRYRYYGREELLRLQDILFHRELGVSLGEIAALLDREGNRLALLEQHRGRLIERMERSRQLITTIDRTIAELKGSDHMKDRDLFKGFSLEKQAEYEEWLVENHDRPGDMRAGIQSSKAAFAKLSEDGMRAAIEEGGAAEIALVERFQTGDSPDVETLAPLLERHRAWIGQMWGRECPPTAYAGVADIYLAHPDFRARYDAHGAGFTEWLTNAMKAHAARSEE